MQFKVSLFDWDEIEKKDTQRHQKRFLFLVSLFIFVSLSIVNKNIDYYKKGRINSK